MLNRDRDGVAPVPSRVGQAGVDGQGPGTKQTFLIKEMMKSVNPLPPGARPYGPATQL